MIGQDFKAHAPLVAAIAGLIGLAISFIAIIDAAVVSNPVPEAFAELSGLNQREQDMRSRLSAMVESPAQLPATALFSTQSVEVSLAGVQMLLREAITNSGGSVESFEASIPDPDAATQRFDLAFRASLPEPGLADFIQTVESATPILIFQSLDIRGSEGSSPTLRLSAQISGFHQDAD